MIKLADTLAPMADFPAVEAKDVAFNDNKSLQEKYDNGELGGGTGSGEENKIDSISVNGSPITPDENKNVDITVPDAYDDTALVHRISDIESDYAKLSDIPSLSGYATETWVNEQGFLTQHQDLSNYATKDELPSLDGYATESYVTEQISNIPSVDLTDYAKSAEIPTTVAELTDSADYAKTSDVNDSISALQTDKANASDLTAHTDDADIHVTVENKTLWNTVDGKVDKTNILTALDDAATDNQVYSAKALNTELDGVVKKTDIVDNLTSTDTDKPLSANQGKILNDTKLNKTDANKLNCVTIDNVSLKEYILTNFTEIGKTYYLIAKTTCTDLPKASNFYITVETPGLYTYKVTAKELNDSNGSYVCTYRTISSSWTAWEKVLITGDIATTISDSSTDTQIPSAKAVNDILSTVTGITNARTYCLLSQLGITTPCTIKDIWDKMPSGSITIVDADSSIITDLDVIRIALGISDNDEVYGILTVVKLKQRTTLEFRRARTNNVMIPDTFIGYCKGSDCTSIRWKQMVITSVANVGVTTITPVNSNITGNIEYTVKNGICYVSMKDLMSTISSTNLLISTTMPKPSINCTASSATAGGNIAMIYIDKNTTNLRGDFYTKNAKSDCSFSYPVAEN